MDEIGSQSTAEPISTSTSTRAATMAFIADLNDNALQELALFARFLAGYNTHEAEEIRETIAKNERAMADRRRKDRETRIQNLSLSEKRVWNRVKRGMAKARHPNRMGFLLDTRRQVTGDLIRWGCKKGSSKRQAVPKGAACKNIYRERAGLVEKPALWCYNEFVKKQYDTVDYSTPIQLKLPVDLERIIKINDAVYSFSEVIGMIHPCVNRLFACCPGIAIKERTAHGEKRWRAGGL